MALNLDNTVDGSEILPFEVGTLSRHLHLLYMSGRAGFQPSAVLNPYVTYAVKHGGYNLYPPQKSWLFDFVEKMGVSPTRWARNKIPNKTGPNNTISNYK